MGSKEEEMNAGVHDRIRKEIEKYKKRWLDWYEIMVKISQKGYRISEIRKAVKEADSS
jgi:hypothetical protein